MENTQTFFHKKGRGKQKIPPSGSLVPVVQKKRDKQGRIVEYPKVEGERVPREERHELSSSVYLALLLGN